MKIALGSVLGLMAFASMASAGQNMAGCGLGTMVFKDNGKWQQVLAATTNGTLGNQTFGITSGTSNCTADGMVLKEKEAEVFVAVNYDSLNQEMSAGQGENLLALAHLMGCDGSSQQQFATTVQANYANSLSHSQTPVELLNALHNVIASDATLNSRCQQ